MLLLSSNLGRMTAMYPSVEGCYGAKDKNAVRTFTAGFVSVTLTERQTCVSTDKKTNEKMEIQMQIKCQIQTLICTSALNVAVNCFIE